MTKESTRAYEFTAVKIRDPIKVKSDDWKETAHEWCCTLNGVDFTYYTGASHKATPPTVTDLLQSLVEDARAAQESFSDWCDNYGYDIDSRKALSMYLQCQETEAKLLKAGINIPYEQERLKDY